MAHSVFVFFFFSSRRRHTRWPRDWSSDVCSSDLAREVPFRRDRHKSKAGADMRRPETGSIMSEKRRDHQADNGHDIDQDRSEERRVGKECRGGREGECEKEKERNQTRVRM